MISQADIIKTLVNKNCTDESILSTALSPNCTPAKLLEEFTKAERFDLALDVSMKLGLDTSPLWRTWAMRCLRNQDFSAAREKFKLCFQRLRPSSSRTASGSVSSGLIAEILAQLTRMEENKLTLNEEINIIKKQFDTQSRTNDDIIYKNETIVDKAKIYAECKYYLNEYGNTKDHIRFYVKHSIWDLLIETLIDNRTSLGSDKFFITDVFMQAASMGHLDDLVCGFIKTDPCIELSGQYFKSIYDHCSEHSYFNILGHVQYKIGDFIAAAESQINHQFLLKPARNYKELAQRLPILTRALEYYQAYLKRLDDKKHSISIKSDLKRKGVIKLGLFSEMSRLNVEKQIGTIESQIDITKNFAINEISGLISEIEPIETDKQFKSELRADDCIPVTLFDRSERRRTYLTALVMVYYDPECRSYFSSGGFELAKKLILRAQLNKLEVFKIAMRIILEDESFDLLKITSSLLDRLKEEFIEDAKLISKHPKNYALRKSSLPPINCKLNEQVQQPRLTQHRTSLTHQGEGVSLFSNFSTISSITTASSSSSASSSSQPLRLSPSHEATMTRTQSKERVQSKIRPIGVSEQKRESSVTLAHRIASSVGTHSPSSVSILSSNNTSDTTTSKASSNFNERREDLLQKRGFPSSNERKPGQTTNSGMHSTLLPSTTMTCLGYFESAQALCDEVVRDSIKNCREADYKMELAKLLSPEARIELFIELGKLSNAQALAFSVSRADYVKRIIEEAEKLNQIHVKTVCQHWLAKHETQESMQQLRQ